jgi:AraC-like DNA-binding protein
MSTRSALGLIYLAQGLQQLGVDPDPVLARHGLSRAKLDPTTRIERTLELRIHADLAKDIADPLIALKLGGFYGLGGYGPLVMLLMTCATAYDALQSGIRYQRLTYLFSTLSYEPGEQLSAMVLTPMAMPPQALRFRVDGEVSGTYKMVRDMQVSFGLDIHAERIDMPYPRPPEAAAYEKHFGCPVSFGHTQARMWMRNEYLRLRLPSSDANAHSMYRAMCDQQLVEQQASAETLSERVLTHLGLFNGSYPSIDKVATSLGRSERTLRRQLGDEGHSFRDLLAQARYAKAQHLLKHTTQPIEAIAQQLGYTESAAFIHAFKRWAGVTPREFRDG